MVAVTIVMITVLGIIVCVGIDISVVLLKISNT
jgi:hypothetical protein